MVMAWLRAVQLWLLSGMAVTYATAGQDCLPTGLLAERVPTAALTIGNGIRVKLRPQNTVKILRLNVALEDDNGQELYELQITEHMEVVWGDMEVTLRDSKSHNNILKVPWPPILVSHSWTTLFLRLHYHELLQLAVIPHEALERSRNFVHAQILIQPAALTARLERGGITKLRLKLHSPNISIEYSVNCDQESFAKAFASEFGIDSNVPFWRSLVWILLSIVGILLVLLIFTFTNMYLNKKKQPNSFILARSKAGSKDGTDPMMVSSTRGGQRKDSGVMKGEDTLQPPRVTVGVVSSRAPSPGHEVDETTMDYVNKAFSYDEE